MHQFTSVPIQAEYYQLQQVTLCWSLYMNTVHNEKAYSSEIYMYVLYSTDVGEKVKFFLCFIKYHAIKIHPCPYLSTMSLWCMGNGYLSQHILKPGTSQSEVVSLIPLLLCLFPEKDPPVPISRLGRTQSQFGWGGKRKYQTRHLAHSLFTVLTELYWDPLMLEKKGDKTCSGMSASSLHAFYTTVINLQMTEQHIRKRPFWSVRALHWLYPKCT
jgi:hypothetical protein